MSEVAAQHDLEALYLIRDRESGLEAAVAVHDTTLGPPRGGTRRRAYPSLADAARDAARLARTMTWKFAVHGLPFGGAKAVIVADPEADRDPARRERQLLAYGAAIERLGGWFGTGPDLGIGAAEVATIQRACSCAVGHRSHDIASRATAAGVRVAIAFGLAALDGRVEAAPLEGKRVAIQGVGAVGGALARDLAGHGARLVVADTDAGRAERIAAEVGADVVAPERITQVAVDAFAPCAAGGVLDLATIEGLRCRVVAGGANDVLVPPEPAAAAALAARGVLYVPDFVANGGAAVALTGCGEEGRPEDVERAAERIARTVAAVTSRALAGAEPRAAALDLAAAALRRERCPDRSRSLGSEGSA